MAGGQDMQDIIDQARAALESSQANEQGYAYHCGALEHSVETLLALVAELAGLA